MKNFILLLAVLFFTAVVLAQAPSRIGYQAVIRNNTNQLVANKQIGMRISIQKYMFGLPPTYTNVYIETQKPTTNDNGLVSLQIGGGTVVGGTINSINWGDGSYYIQTETDISGGTNYSITGKSQILSVPYALNAKYVENVQTDSTLDGQGNATKPLKIAQQSAVSGQVLQWDGTAWKPGSNITLDGTKIKKFGYYSFKTRNVIPFRISYQDLGFTNPEDISNFIILSLEVGWQPFTNNITPDQYRSIKDGIYYEICLPVSGFSGIKVYFPDKLEYWDQFGRIIYLMF